MKTFDAGTGTFTSLISFIQAKVKGLKLTDDHPILFPKFITNDEVFIKLKSPSKVEMVSILPGAAGIHRANASFISPYYRWLKQGRLGRHGFWEVSECTYMAAKGKAMQMTGMIQAFK